MGLFKTYSERQIKRIMPTVNEIEALADKYSAMSEAELRAVTPALKARLAAGETLDDILPDAFAAVREAATRVLEKRPFTCQLMGGVIIHQGRIAEMKTGEGKTLVATMPAYLNALSGKGVHVVTVNDYLARRDSEEMGRVYGYLGLSTGLILSGGTSEEKRAAYACDITYGTNNEFGFDYLRDNMVLAKSNMVQRGHNFAIVDEVDSILIDEARTPLIISGQGAEVSDLYDKANALVRSFRQLRIKEMDDKSDNENVAEDYIVDEKARTATLTKHGVRKAEQFFGLENLSDIENSDINHYITQALKAYGIMRRDEDYIVTDDNKVMIVDSFTGRIMYGRRFSDGLHQAIEAKEGVKIENENQTLATITFQNYFRLYGKLSGMTGTALTEDEEFREIYKLDVVEIPTNKPMIRDDQNDVVYKSERGKYAAIIEKIKECHEAGQPVLVGTVSVEKSEKLSEMLKKVGIKHNVLNAKQHAREAEIVAQAGKFGAVTISTNMAGRGTDIMLGGNAEFLAKNELKKRGCDEETIYLATGSSPDVSDEVLEARNVYHEYLDKYRSEIAPEAEKVKAAGGLFILGTERHEARRIDNQLRGRSGRQGDPGASRFYLSLQDDLMRLFGGDRVEMMVSRLGIPEDQPIAAGILSNTIENAQKRLESENFGRRKNVLEYDDVMNLQRTVIYQQRREVLEGADISDKIKSMMSDVISSTIAEASGEAGIDLQYIKEKLAPHLTGTTATEIDALHSAEEIAALLNARAEARYKYQEKVFGENMRELERMILLRTVDQNWMDHLAAMDDLRDGIGLNAYAQRKPIVEYKIASADMFDEMTDTIKRDTVKAVLLVSPRRTEQARPSAVKVKSMGTAAPSSEKRAPVVKKAAEKVGRNDPCPCGSGKKYKNCCMLKEND